MGASPYSSLPVYYRLVAMQISSGSPLIVNNQIVANDLSGFGLSRSDAVLSNGLSTLISNNTVIGDVIINSGQSQINGNVILGLVSATDPAIIFNNTLTNGDINVSGKSKDTCIISNNLLENGGLGITGKATVENNYVTGSISVSGLGEVVIQNNTVNDGIVGTITANSSIIYNNIGGGVYLTSYNDINASFNWWGSANTQAINNTIHDFKNDFNLGIVSFIPFLTLPNPEATPNPSATMPTTNPITVTPEYSSLLSTIILFAVVMIAIVCFKKTASCRISWRRKL